MKNLRITFNTDLFMKCLKDQFLDFFQIDHINNCKTDNRIKNLQLLTHKQNVQKSSNKAVISTCIDRGKKKQYVSITKASLELSISVSNISKICSKKYHKSSSSKKDGKKYTFEYLSQIFT